MKTELVSVASEFSHSLLDFCTRSLFAPSLFQQIESHIEIPSRNFVVTGRMIARPFPHRTKTLRFSSQLSRLLAAIPLERNLSTRTTYAPGSTYFC